MIILADGGSTKTDWRLMQEDKVFSLATAGINPLFSDRTQIFQVLSESEINVYKNEINTLYFYGAGLANDQIKASLFKIFSDFFSSNTQIFIDDDMVAAARALFNDKPGIACILGTGSNSCFYNGDKIEYKIPALGYILGDEGSGAHMGKLLVNALHKNDFSSDLTKKLLNYPELGMPQIIENVYKRPLANRYLASFTKIINQNIENIELQNLVTQSFELFIDKNLKKYKNFKHMPIGIVGSVGYYFSDILTQALLNQGFNKPIIMKSPIDALGEYHKYKKSV